MSRVIDSVRKLIPPLDGSLHKGQSGRVGVLGGARDYTGAPFFAAISALRLGADLSHVICSPTAAPAIKSYSPDLIVHPILDINAPHHRVRADLDSILSRLHVLIVGPGLGREPYMQTYAHIAIHTAREQGLFIVFDADALGMIADSPPLVKGYRRAVITPNLVEFNRLMDRLDIREDEDENKKAMLVSSALGGVTVLQKGPLDIVAIDTGDPNESDFFKINIQGGMKRCGGQGDILAGLVGTFMAWGKSYEDGVFGDKSIPASRIPFLAAVGGSMVTRVTSQHAYHKLGRSVVTQDMLSEIGGAFKTVF